MKLVALRRLLCSATGAVATMACVFAAHAGTVDRCRQQERDNAAFAVCVEAENNRSMNGLRAATLASQDAVRSQVRESGRQTALRQFRTAQARFVRQRAAACGKARAGIERQACEADMNFSQTEKLKVTAR